MWSVERLWILSRVQHIKDGFGWRKWTCMYDFLNSCWATDSFTLNPDKYFCFKFSHTVIKDASSKDEDDTQQSDFLSPLKPFSDRSERWPDGSSASVKSEFSSLLTLWHFRAFSSHVSMLCILKAFSELPGKCCSFWESSVAQFATIGRISVRLWWRWIFNKGSRRKSSECSSTTAIASLYKDTAWERFFSINAIPARPFKAITNFLRASSPSILVLPIRTYKQTFLERLRSTCFFFFFSNSFVWGKKKGKEKEN